MGDPTPEELDALIHLIGHNIQWGGLQEIDREAYRQARAAITALRAERDMAVATREATQDALTLCRERMEAAEAEVERLTAALDVERAGADELAKCLRGAMSVSYDWKPAWDALAAHAAWREGGV